MGFQYDPRASQPLHAAIATTAAHTAEAGAKDGREALKRG